MVHTALAEFKAARHAIKGYVELIERNRAKVARNPETGLVTDTLVTSLATLSAGVEMLCRYGKKSDVQYGHELCALLQTWLDEVSNGRFHNHEGDNYLVVVAHAYRAIGFCKATWARFTSFSEDRLKLLNAALTYYQKSLSAEYEDDENPLSHFYLALAQVETSNVSNAVITIKEAIRSLSRFVFDESSSRPDSPSKSHGSHRSNDPDSPSSRTLLLNCWHLLLLLLTAQEKHDDFDRGLAAALLPYGGHSIFRGDEILSNSSSLWSMSEKRRLVELKMTQINAVIEAHTDSAAVALLPELIQLHSNIFSGKVVEEDSWKYFTNPSNLPKGSRRSLRKNPLSTPRDGATQVGASGSSGPHTSGADQQNFLGRHVSNKLQKRPIGGPSSYAQSPSETFTDVVNSQSSSHAPDQIGIAMTHDLPVGVSASDRRKDPLDQLQRIPSAAENMDHINPNYDPVSPEPTSPKQFVDPRDPYINNEVALIHVPEPYYSSDYLQRRQDAFTCDIWVFVASVYRRAGGLEEAEKACKEALTCISQMRKHIAKVEGLSAEISREPGFGGLKSLGELFADAQAERASLDLAKGNKVSARNKLAEALNAHSNHLEATLGYGELLLKSFQPLFEQSNAVQAAILPPLGGAFPGEYRRCLTPEEAKNATADRDVAHYLLKQLVGSGVGFLCAAAWQALAKACSYAFDAPNEAKALIYCLELEKGADLRPSIVLGNLV